MRLPNRKPVDKRAFQCPQCNKPRLIRPLDHTVSLDKHEYKTRDGSSVSLLVDICDACQARNFRQHFEPSKEDIRKVVKSMHAESELPGEQSIEDLL